MILMSKIGRGIGKHYWRHVLLLVFGALPGFAAAQTADSAQPFLGRWDVTLQTPQRQYSSWFDIQQVHGKLQVRMVARWGHARLLPHAEINNGVIRFVSPKDEEASPDDMVFEGHRSGDQLVGQTHGPDGAVWTWHAERAPALLKKGTPHWGQPIQLFNGKDLSGWELIDAAKPSWQAADGKLVSQGTGSDLRSAALFGDFKLHIEFNCAPGANSGVYLRGRYELQIEDDSEQSPPDQRMGGIYGYLAPIAPVPRTPGVWQTYDVTFIGRQVTVVLNGKTVIDHKTIPGITGGALDSKEALPGPFVLQGSEPGQVAFRNIVLTPALE